MIIISDPGDEQTGTNITKLCRMKIELIDSINEKIVDRIISDYNNRSMISKIIGYLYAYLIANPMSWLLAKMKKK